MEINILNTESYSIRLATLADLDRIIEIWKQGLGFAIGNIPKANELEAVTVRPTFEKNILSQNDIFKFWVHVKHDGNVISWCSIMPFHPNPLLQNTWGIMSMYVDNAHQNKMHGYYFSKFVLEDASRTSLRYILSIVAAKNERVIRLSKKMGFVSIGALPHNKAHNDLVNTELMIYEV